MAGFQARKQVAVTGPGSPGCLLPPQGPPPGSGELEPVLGLSPLGPGPACFPRARRAAHCLFSVRVCVLQPGDAVCHGSRRLFSASPRAASVLCSFPLSSLTFPL